MAELFRLAEIGANADPHNLRNNVREENRRLREDNFRLLDQLNQERVLAANGLSEHAGERVSESNRLQMAQLINRGVIRDVRHVSPGVWVVRTTQTAPEVPWEFPGGVGGTSSVSPFLDSRNQQLPLATAHEELPDRPRQIITDVER